MRTVNTLLTVCAALAALCALALTFTVSDYFIFNRIAEYGFFFCLSQWVKKAGLILILLAVFFKCKGCADAVKYVLPLFLILSCCLYGNFFEAELAVKAGDTNAEIFKSLNSFFPKWLNITLFFVQNVAYAVCCALFFVRDGVKVKAKCFANFGYALILSLPLNIFENFFDINTIETDSFLRFYNFTIWHFLAIGVLAGVTIGLYYFLKDKPRALQDKYLAAIAICLLLQYHSKDSVVLGDGYNVYNTVFACLPLFICNIGVYVASISVILKKKVLYAISFFIHAVGALTVFVYFGKDSMSDYGIFCSYSILFFCLTHCLLFALCVLPSALGHYKFKIRDCIIPLVYYFIVIVIASVASALVSSYSMTWTTEDGRHLVYDEPYVMGDGYIMPNYAFTQVNPLPIEVPNILPLGGIFAYINIFYVFLVYLAYVGLFFAFYGLYRAFLAIRKVVLARTAPAPAATPAAAEAAATDEDETEEK